MKRHQFKPREFRQFLDGNPSAHRRTLRPPTSVVAVEGPAEPLALTLESHLELNPFLVVRRRTPVVVTAPSGDERRFAPDFWIMRLGARDPRPARFEPCTADAASLRPFLAFEILPARGAAAEARAQEYLTELGVRECFLFQPNAPEHEAYRAFRWKDGCIVEIKQWSKLWHSFELELDFGVCAGAPCVSDPRNGRLLQSPLEDALRRQLPPSAQSPSARLSSSKGAGKS
jgi:hypothetical protein